MILLRVLEVLCVNIVFLEILFIFMQYSYNILYKVRLGVKLTLYIVVQHVNACFVDCRTSNDRTSNLKKREKNESLLHSH